MRSPGRGSEPEQPRGVSAQDLSLLLLRDVESPDHLEHPRNAADLVRIVAPGQDLAGAGELDREAERLRIEVHRVVVEGLQVFAGRLPDVGAALGERLVAPIEPFGEVGYGPAEMAQHPSNPR